MTIPQDPILEAPQLAPSNHKSHVEVDEAPASATRVEKG